MTKCFCIVLQNFYLVHLITAGLFIYLGKTTFLFSILSVKHDA